MPTVFIGGGTPSLLGPERMGRLLDTMGCCYRILPGAEITMEANPCTVDYDSLVQYRKAGVSRLSLGLQSSWDEELRALGRIHTWQQFLDTYGAAAAAGFAHINVDLMSGLPGQTPGSYETTLKRVAELEPGPEHISAYSLILEEGTAFAERYGAGELLLPNEETERELYGLTKHILREYGYQRYEISNYAKRAANAATMWDTGPGKTIWALALAPPPWWKMSDSGTGTACRHILRSRWGSGSRSTN